MLTAKLATDEKQLWPPLGLQESPFFRYFQQFSPSFADVADSGASVAGLAPVIPTSWFDTHSIVNLMAGPLWGRDSHRLC